MRAVPQVTDSALHGLEVAKSTGWSLAEQVKSGTEAAIDAVIERGVACTQALDDVLTSKLSPNSAAAVATATTGAAATATAADVASSVVLPPLASAVASDVAVAASVSAVGATGADSPAVTAGAVVIGDGAAATTGLGTAAGTDISETTSDASGTQGSEPNGVVV